MTKTHLNKKFLSITGLTTAELARIHELAVPKENCGWENCAVHTTTHYSALIDESGDLSSPKPKDLSFGKKPPISLVPPTFIIQVARCMEDGAKKRSPYNYRKEPVSAMQLLDKILRHTLDAVDGKDLTEDSKLSNLASAAADIAVYLDAQEHGTLVDDRPK